MLDMFKPTVGNSVSYTPPKSHVTTQCVAGAVKRGVGNAKSYVSYALALSNQWFTVCVGNVGKSNFLRFLRSALHVGRAVGNVGNTYRFPTFLRPRCDAVSVMP